MINKEIAKFLLAHLEGNEIALRVGRDWAVDNGVDWQLVIDDIKDRAVTKWYEGERGNRPYHQLQQVFGFVEDCFDKAGHKNELTGEDTWAQICLVNLCKEIIGEVS